MVMGPCFRRDDHGVRPSLRANGSREARPMTGSAKQSMEPRSKAGLLRRFRLRSLSYDGQVAPRNDGSHSFAISPRIRASFTGNVAPPEIRGRRECRALDAPTASRAIGE